MFRELEDGCTFFFRRLSARDVCLRCLIWEGGFRLWCLPQIGVSKGYLISVIVQNLCEIGQIRDRVIAI